VEKGREGGDPLEDTREKVQEDLPHPIEKEVQHGTQKEEPCKEWQGIPPSRRGKRKLLGYQKPLSSLVMEGINLER
jgi:hypothetical protein